MQDKKIDLFCQYGKLYSLRDFGQTLVSTHASCHSTDFLYTPNECHSQDVSYSYQHLLTLEVSFYQNCFGKTNCSLPLNHTVVPDNCTHGYNESDLVYFVQAVCKSEDVNIFLMDKLYMNKESIGLVVVILDLLMGILIFMLISVWLKTMTKVCDREINEAVVSAKEFTVQLKGLPQHDSVRELKPFLWAWIEKVCQKEEYK